MRTITALSIFGIMLAALAAAAPGPDVCVDMEGVTLNGYDAVAYFTEGRAVKGRADYSAEYRGAEYLFSSDQHRDMFKADPQKYAPQFGGWCAYGLALGKKFAVDGQAFEIVDGKLYLNLDKKIQQKWAEDRDNFIVDANANWPKIKHTPADQL